LAEICSLVNFEKKEIREEKRREEERGQYKLNELPWKEVSCHQHLPAQLHLSKPVSRANNKQNEKSHITRPCNKLVKYEKSCSL
jgi:hypothetical protein